MHAQSNYTNTKLKAWPWNGVGLFYSPGPRRGNQWINNYVLNISWTVLYQSYCTTGWAATTAST